MNKILKKGYMFIMAIVIVIILISVDIKSVLQKYRTMNNLNNNLDFFEKILSDYSLIIILCTIILIYIIGRKKIIINIPKIIIAGMEISLKNSEKIVRANIQNYLNTKRSLFCIDLEHDNYFDVIKSYYEIYSFLRNQMKNFENANHSENECYRRVQDLMKKINLFLTKYQSDYRRWYKFKTDNNFEPFLEIQSKYSKYHEMNADFKKLNKEVAADAKYFGVDIEKWNNT